MKLLFVINKILLTVETQDEIHDRVKWSAGSFLIIQKQEDSITKKAQNETILIRSKCRSDTMYESSSIGQSYVSVKLCLNKEAFVDSENKYNFIISIT